MTEFNVSESDGTVEIVLEANGTSQFEYSITLVIGDNTTGEHCDLDLYALEHNNIVFNHAMCLLHINEVCDCNI